MDAPNSTAAPPETSPVESPELPVAGVALEADDGKQPVAPEAIQRHDFRQPAFLSALELRKLRQQHEILVHALAARLSIYLRLDFGLQLGKLQAIKYQDFLATLPQPCHLTLFKADPLRGICILGVNPRLALAMIDRLMGGAGSAGTLNRDLSEVEVALLDQIVQLMLSEWCHHWEKTQALHPILLGHESSARFLQTSSADTIMVLVPMEARLGDCTESFQFAFPHTTLEPLTRGLSAQLSPAAERPTSATGGSAPKWNRMFDDLRIPMVADWSGLRLTARELAHLKIGDVVSLPAEFSSQVRVRLGSTPKFVGRLGTAEKHWAIELAEILRT